MKKFDIAAMIGAVDRKVIQVERDQRNATAVIASRSYAATPEEVWDALTTRERIGRWFLPIEGDLVLGGRYQLKGNAGGTITACEPPRHLAVTWEMRGDVSWVDVKLEKVKARETRLTLEHVAFVPEPFWDEYGPGAVGLGWDLGLLGLELHLEAPDEDTAAEGQAWTMSPEGVSFQRGLSDSWCHVDRLRHFT